MAEASTLKWRVSEIATCPICLEDFQRPKSLPCVHSFCLRCLQGQFKDKSPRDEVPCPVCRDEFTIPAEKGLDGLPNNFFLQNLIDAKDMASNEKVGGGIQCEVCQVEKDDDARDIPPATEFCLNCDQKLCKRCSRPHRVWRGGGHRVIHLGAETAAELVQLRGSYCERHTDEKIKLYCFDCKSNVCLMCIAIGHRNHNCEEVGKVVADLDAMIGADIKPVRERINSFQAAIAQVDQETNRVMESIEAVDGEIKERRKVVEQLVVQQMNDLAQELDDVKAEANKEAMTRKDRLQFAVTAMESFTVYSSELRAKGSSCDITRSANELHSRAQELLQAHPVPVDYSASYVSLRAVNVEELKKGRNELIGRLQKNEGRPTGMQEVLLQTAREQELKRELQKLRKRNEEIEDLLKMSSENERDLSDKLKEATKKVEETDKQAKDQEQALQEKLRLAEERRTEFQKELAELVQKQYLKSDVRVVHTLSMEKTVCGLTIVDDQLCVLCKRSYDQLELYSTSDYKLTRRVSISELGDDDNNDITSLESSLYISDARNSCVYRLELTGDGSTKKLAEVPKYPYGISTSRANSLLVTCHQDVLLELTRQGECIRKLQLRSLSHPLHALELPDGRYVVSCKYAWSAPPGLYVVNADGKMTKSYRNERRSEAEQLKEPRHMAMDNNGFIFVADKSNYGRVLLLNPWLQFVRRIETPRGRCYRLHLDNATRRLFVAHENLRSTISVVQL